MSSSAKRIGVALLVPAVMCLAAAFAHSANQPAVGTSTSAPSMCVPTSGFIGWLYGQPVNYGTHAGVDIWTEQDLVGTPPGNPVYSAADGTLVHIYDSSSPFQEVAASDPAATTLVMEHGIGGQTVYSWYVHMANENSNESYVNPALETGAFYPKGTLLGYQGNRTVSGVGSPVVHLHFQISTSDVTLSSAQSLDLSEFLGTDLSSPRPPEWMTPIQSNCTGAQTLLFTLDAPNAQEWLYFGDSVAMGDVNADGKGDIAVGATGEDVGGNDDQGWAYVFSGADGSLLLTLDTPNPHSDAYFATSVAMGDVNADGKGDVAVGATGEDVGGNDDQGRAYVFSGADGSLLLTLDTPNPQQWARFGQSLAVSDVSGDGKGDIVVGVPSENVGGNVNQGRVYVFSGADGSLLLTLDTPNPQEWVGFGFSPAAGDVNGDGKADIAVGARNEDVEGNAYQGRAYIYSGADGSLLFTLNSPNPQAFGNFGDSVAMGDVNADGKGDVAVGATGEDVGGNDDQGRAYVFSGADGSLLLTLDTPNPQLFGHFGRMVALGDVNGDGDADIAVGVPEEGVGADYYQGKVYVFSGADGSLLLTLDSPNPQRSARFGEMVVLGDVNADNKADIVVGVPYEDVGGNYNQGRVYVFGRSACGPLGVAPGNPYWNTYDDLICTYAAQFDLPPQLLKAVIAFESGGLRKKDKGGGPVEPARAYLYEPATDKSIQDLLDLWPETTLPDSPPAAGQNPYNVPIPIGTTAAEMCASVSATRNFTNCKEVIGNEGQYAFVAQYRIAASYGLGQIVYRWHYDKLPTLLLGAVPESLYNAELNVRLTAQILAGYKCGTDVTGGNLDFEAWRDTLVRYNSGQGCPPEMTLYPDWVRPYFDSILDTTPNTSLPSTSPARRIRAVVESSLPPEAIVDHRTVDLKGTGDLQLVTLTAIPEDDYNFAGVLRIYTDPTGDVLEWEGPPVAGTTGAGVLAVVANPAIGRTTLQAIWGVGAHGSMSQFVYWDESVFREVTAVDAASSPDPLAFLSDSGQAVTMSDGSIWVSRRPLEAPLASGGEERTFEWDGTRYELTSLCPDQTDTDGDGLGDLCDVDDDDDMALDGEDPCPTNPDCDGDGFLDAIDNCPSIPNADQTDADGDGLGDVCDNCPNSYNPNQGDADGDTLGNACDHCLDVPGPPEKNGCPLCGDVDCDDDVDAVDALFILQYVVGLRPPSDHCPPPEGHLYLPAGDVDCDDDVDAVDALFVLQHVVGLRPELCVCPEP